MKGIKIYIAAVALMGTATGVSAQALSSGYFTDGYLFKHQLNPALESDKSYFSIPMLGNVNMGVKGNVGLANFLYPTSDNKLTTFMNSSVSADDFLGGLRKVNRMGLDMNMSILSMGFRAWGGFNTLDIGLRSNASLYIPKDFFKFMKMGQSGPNTVYDLGTMGITSTAFVEVALGHSRQINDKLRVGAKVKALLGGAYANMNFSNTKIEMNEDMWKVSANGEMNVAVAGLNIPTKAESGAEYGEGEGTLVDFENMEMGTPGLGGFGLALDLGATYEVIDNLTVSAAIRDLGFMSWNNNIYASTSNEPWIFEGFNDLSIDGDSPNSLDNQLDQLTDDFESYTNLHRRSAGGKLSKALAATLVIGAEYEMPFYNKLSAGFLSTTKINGPYSWSEGRFAANISPLSWFEEGINYGISSYGSTMGWIVNFHPKVLSLFVGMDYIVGKVSKQYIPLNNMNMNLSMGLSVTF